MTTKLKENGYSMQKKIFSTKQVECKRAQPKEPNNSSNKKSSLRNKQEFSSPSQNYSVYFNKLFLNLQFTSSPQGQGGGFYNPQQQFNNSPLKKTM